MVPLMYTEGNMIDSTVTPLAVGAADVGLTKYFQRWLLQRAISVFKWTLPENWDRDYFLYTLYTRGTIAVLNVPQYGVIPQECDPYGYNVFYRPVRVVIANPVIEGGRSIERTINKDCVVFKLAPDWRGCMDVINYYATQMALAAQGYSINMINTRLAYVFASDDSTMGESFKKMADKILSGQPYVAVDSKLFDKNSGKLKVDMFEQNLSQNFIAPQILEILSTLINMFDADIGIDNVAFEKKERLLEAEVEKNNQHTKSLAELWLEGWKKEINRVKTMFGVEMNVDWRTPDEPQEVTQNEDRND